MQNGIRASSIVIGFIVLVGFVIVVPSALGYVERQNLFNGENLNGWTVTGKGRWSVQLDDVNHNGKRDPGERMCIVGEQDPVAKAESWLLSEEEFSDFSLVAKVRVTPGGNSGLFFRIPKDRTGSPPWRCGYEVQLWDQDEKNPTGTIYEIAKAPRGLQNVGKWNRITITAIGERLVVVVNGKKAVDVITDRSMRGRIGFQSHGGEKFAGMKVEIQSVSVKSITKVMPITPSPIYFNVRKLADGPSEGCQVFDVNKDGHLDITYGPSWYEGPNWNPHPCRAVKRYANFMNNYGEVAIDVDADGWTDIVSGGWFANEQGKHWFAWYRNPGLKGGMWKETVIEQEKLFIETLMAADVDGDGKKNEFFMDCDQAAWYERTGKGSTAKFVRHNIGKPGVSHGLGFGDLDGDGRGDLVRPRGFFRCVGDPRKDNWEYLPEFNLGHAGIPCPVHDLNGDGLPDIIYGQAHDFGLCWLEQGRAGGKRTWTDHIIDQGFSQAHTISLADLDADGDLDIITGKRYHGHGGNDPGAEDGNCLLWYEISPGPTFRKHRISFVEKGVGIGMQVPVVDIDEDGDLDLICPGQTGLYLVENLMK